MTARHITRLGTLLAAMFIGAGCVTTSMDEQFAELDELVRSRTGYDVAWIGVTAEQESVAAYVTGLLDGGLTPDEAVQVALLNNRGLQAMYARMGIEVGHFIQAGLLPNPVIDAEMKLRDGRRIVEGVIVEDFLEILLIPLRRRLQGAQLEATQARVAAEVIDLAAETRIAYWDYVAARQHHALAEDVLLAGYARFRTARQLRTAGNISLLALYREQAAFEQAKLDVGRAQMEMLENREQLNALMGLWGEGTLWKAPSRLPAVPEEEIDLERLESRVIEASLDLTIQLYGLLAQAQELGIRRITTVIPELKGGITGEREPTEEIELVKRTYANGETEYKLKEEAGPNVWWAGPSLNVEIPLFDQKQGSRAAARMSVRRRWEEIHDLAVDIRAAARLAAYRLEYARKRAKFFNEMLVPLTHQVVLQAHLQYNAMHFGIFDLLRDKQDELMTARDYIETLRHYWTARTQLEQLLMGRMYDTEFHAMGGPREVSRSMGIQQPPDQNQEGH